MLQFAYDIAVDFDAISVLVFSAEVLPAAQHQQVRASSLTSTLCYCPLRKVRFQLDHMRRGGPTHEDVQAFKNIWMATWADRAIASDGVQEAYDRIAGKLQQRLPDLQELEAHRFATHHKVQLEDRKQAFRVGLELLHAQIMQFNGFHAANRMQNAIERSAHGMGDALPLLVYTLLEPEAKARLMDYSVLSVPISREAENQGASDADFYSRPRDITRQWRLSWAIRLRLLGHYRWTANFGAAPGLGAGFKHFRQRFMQSVT